MFSRLRAHNKQKKDVLRMCTAVSVTSGQHYFGRNLDFEHDFGEQVVITPRRFPFSFKNGHFMSEHYAMIGTALPIDGYPLYFDATNEKGLSIAGLNFPGNAYYSHPLGGQDNVASFEFVPWLLSQCATVAEAEAMLQKICITNDAFRADMSPTPLHWLIADRQKSIVVEQTKEGLSVFENPTGVLTNNPPFNGQMTHLAVHMFVTAKEAVNRFSDKLHLEPCSRGMGGLGLPGDFSSASRFVKASFLALNTVFGETEQERVNAFFRILGSVFQLEGCAQVGDGFEMTRYTSCCNTDKGIYYYSTYENSSICAVDLHRTDLDGAMLLTYPMERKQSVFFQN